MKIAKWMARLHIRDQTSGMTNSSFLFEVFDYCTQNYVVTQHMTKTLFEMNRISIKTITDCSKKDGPLRPSPAEISLWVQL